MEDGFYAVKNGEVYKIAPRIKMPIAKSVNVKTGVIHYQTNADRIRSMTDEELAKFITSDLCELLCCSPLFCDGDCDKKMIDWLKQEVGNENNT